MKAKELIHEGYYCVNGKPYQYNAVRGEMMNWESNLTVLTDGKQELYCVGRYRSQPSYMRVEPMPMPCGFEVEGISVQYVHRYQMAMRLLGMKETLKVEGVWKI